MGLSVKKIYCKDCEKYRYGGRDGKEYCDIEVDDYFSESHKVQAVPKTLNSENNCPHFTKAEA